MTQCWEWSRTISAEMVGVQGPPRPLRGPGQGPGGGFKGATIPLRKRILHIKKPKLGLSRKEKFKLSDLT